MARMGDRRGAYSVLWGELRERKHLEDLGVDGRIIQSFISRKLDGETWTGLFLIRVGTGSGHL